MKTTSLKQSQEDAENTEYKNSSKNEELIKQESIKNTPFDKITIKDEGTFIAWGKFRLTEIESNETINNRIKRLEEGKTDWDILGALITCIQLNINETNKED